MKELVEAYKELAFRKASTDTSEAIDYDKETASKVLAFSMKTLRNLADEDALNEMERTDELIEHMKGTDETVRGLLHHEQPKAEWEV